MNYQYHSHSLCGSTSYDDGHLHHYGTVTELAPSGVSHIHRFCGDTSYIDGHTHPYYSETGPAILTKDGRHYHEYHAIVQCVDGHIHHICGYTSID
ncbi:YmaF family protein [Caldicoprobacter faecalis]|uniref:YmaF family protein n=1 Tax=Caldicoprobacter faecalis TaxID=937334 RepID=A0A1I5UZU6_9FIRM|nr:YmaF family protein [Caldicoprobacter faecalis]SFQ00748.1 YmaF family protein [Caldicoprobacter faecalis]